MEHLSKGRKWEEAGKEKKCNNADQKVDTEEEKEEETEGKT